MTQALRTSGNITIVADDGRFGTLNHKMFNAVFY